MRRWDQSLGPGPGLGDKRARFASAAAERSHPSPALNHGARTGMAEALLLPLLLVNWIITRGLICGEVLGLPHWFSVGLLPLQCFDQKDQGFFFFLFVFFLLLFYFYAYQSFLVAGFSTIQPVQGIWEMEKKKKVLTMLFLQSCPHSSF